MKKLLFTFVAMILLMNAFATKSDGSTSSASSTGATSGDDKLVLWTGTKDNVSKFTFGPDMGIDVKNIKDDITKFTVISPDKWGKVFINVLGYDIDKYPALEVIIDSVEKDTDIQVRVTTNWDDEVELLGRTYARGTKVLDLKKLTGWKGKKDFMIVLYFEGIQEKGVSLRSISGKKSVSSN